MDCRCFVKLRIAGSILVKGENIIELQTYFTENVDLEPIYLLGQFGVTILENHKTLTSLPQKIWAGDLVKQGLPFYSGKVKYILQNPVRLDPGERAYIRLGKYEGACIKIHGTNKAVHMIDWQPYEADITEWVQNEELIILEVVLTRRNTFGPLHLLPPDQAAYGSDSFLSEGENFTDHYVLLPSGLLNEPELIVMKQGE